MNQTQQNDREQVRIVGARVLTLDAETCSPHCTYFIQHATYCYLFDESLDMVDGRIIRCSMCKEEELEDGRQEEEEE